MNGFTFFENYYKSISDPDNGLTEEEQGRLYNAIFSYMFNGVEPELKGACRMAFQLIKPSLDLSKVRSESKKKGQKGVEEEGNFDSENQNEIKPESNPNQNEIKTEQNEIKTEQNEIKPDSSPSLRNKKEEIRKSNNITDGLSACTRETDDSDECVSDYLEFMREHPNIVEDIKNPDLIATVDFNLLSEKIAESSYLQTRCSLSWLIGNYFKIKAGKYKDFDRHNRGSPPADSQMDFILQQYNEAKERDNDRAKRLAADS